MIDYRIYDPDGDHKSKLDHMREMVYNAIVYKQLQFSACAMDTWYAAADEMQYIDEQGKTFYCPLKDNRYVRAADQTGTFCRVDDLIWSAEELRSGKLIHLQGQVLSRLLSNIWMQISPTGTGQDLIAISSPGPMNLK